MPSRYLYKEVYRLMFTVSRRGDLFLLENCPSISLSCVEACIFVYKRENGRENFCVPRQRALREKLNGVTAATKFMFQV